MRFNLKTWAFLTLACFAGPALFAQVDTGTILGTVTDSTGAVVPGAKVTLMNEGTSLTQSAETRQDGTYIFTPVKIGSYTLEVQSKGFQTIRRTGVSVNIEQQAVVNVTLSPGEITQTVEVQAAAPLLQTENGSVGQVIESTSINDLPLNGRNYNFLARLTTGVTYAQADGRGLAATGWFAANGTRPAQNNYLLDGIDNNSNSVDFLSGAAYVLKPPVDAIAEFKLQTNSFSAEFGRAGGAVLNATLKSGSNGFHGSGWEFLRNDKLDAADFFQNASGEKQGEFRQNIFGVTAGGPIQKNKTFWFADFEGTRIRQASPQVVTVPTAAERNSGFTNFSDLIALQSGTVGTDLLGRSYPLGTIFDPATTRTVQAGQMDPTTGRVAASTGYVRDPFPGNIVPSSRLDPNAIKLMSLYPAPNGSGLYGNYGVNPLNTSDTNAFDVRVDENFNEKNQMFARYSFSDSPIYRPGPFQGVADGGGFNNGDASVRAQGAALSYTHSFSPTLINEARAGFNREHQLRLQPEGDDTTNIPLKYGIPGVLQVPGNGGLPNFAISGLQQLGSAGWLVSDRYSNTIQFSENLTKIYGSHTFKGGMEAQSIQFPWTAPPSSRGNFSWSGLYTSSPNLNDGSTARAQFLLTPMGADVANGINNVGGADSVSASNFGSVANTKAYIGIYFQDDWKVSRRLTLNLGLRWDHFSLVGEKYGAQGNFVPGTPGAGAEFIIPETRKGNPPLSQSFVDALAQDGIALVYTNKYGSGLGNAQTLNFAPRFGFAYQATSKLVVRGGYGIYYGGFENRGGYPNLGYNYPFQYSFSYPAPNAATPITYPDGTNATLERGLLGIPLNPLDVSGDGLSFRGIEFNYKTPYTQSYNLTVQYEVAPSQSFEVGYVASLGRHLETFSGTNNVSEILPPNVDPQGYVPFPDFARGASYATSNANSHYHSLQTKYTWRLHDGLNFLVGYTFAKTLTNADDLLSGGGIAGFRAPDLPGFGIQKDMGLASFDVRHAFTFSGTYDLPVGKGKSYLNGMNRVGEAILGGWSTNWIVTAYSGQPQTVGCTTTTTAGLGCYALMVPGQSLYGGQHNVSQFYNPLAFANPAAATTIGQSDYGPLGGGPTQVTGPPFRRMDFSLFKQFPIRERFKLEFRAEAFNLTNTPNFALPSNLNFQDLTNFGQITSTRDNPDDPRELQFALKLYW